MKVTPRTSSLVDFGKKTAPEKGSTKLTLPPPLNLLITVPPLPKSIMTAMLADPDDETKPRIPNFEARNKKIASRIDTNWQTKFRFLMSEGVKAFHYMRALQLGVSTGSSATSSMVIANGSESAASLLLKTGNIERPSPSIEKRRSMLFAFKLRRNQSSKLRNDPYQIEPTPAADFKPKSGNSATTHEMQIFGGSENTRAPETINSPSTKRYAELLKDERDLEISRRLFAEFRILEQTTGIEPYN